MKFNELVKTRRQEMGKTQQEMADILEVTINTVQNWESDQKDIRPAYDLWDKIANAYNVDEKEIALSFVSEKNETEEYNKYDYLIDDYKLSSLEYLLLSQIEFMQGAKNNWIFDMSKYNVLSLIDTRNKLLKNELISLKNKTFKDEYGHTVELEKNYELTDRGTELFSIIHNDLKDNHDLKDISFKDAISLLTLDFNSLINNLDFLEEVCTYILNNEFRYDEDSSKIIIYISTKDHYYSGSYRYFKIYMDEESDNLVYNYCKKDGSDTDKTRYSHKNAKIKNKGDRYYYCYKDPKYSEEEEVEVEVKVYEEKRPIRYIKDNKTQNIHSFYSIFPKSWFEKVHEECSEQEYLSNKAKYKEQMEFYEKNKDNPLVAKPKVFKEIFKDYWVPSEECIKFAKDCLDYIKEKELKS